MPIWRGGYKEAKNAPGWAARVFAKVSINRFCKYCVSFDKDVMQRLKTYKRGSGCSGHTAPSLEAVVSNRWRILSASVFWSSARLGGI
jgi:hypothetical protein